MNTFQRVCVAGLMIAATTACSSSTSPKTLQSRTAGVLGVGVEQVTLSNMRTDKSGTYYTATANGKRYACVAEGGMVKIMQLGMTNPPTCKRAD